MDAIFQVDKKHKKHMKYNFEVNDRQIIVNDFYIGKEPLNEYFKYHKLNSIYHIILQFVLYHIL